MAEEHVRVTPGKKCCIIKTMSSIIEFIRSEEIKRVTKREMAICQPECFKLILKSERIKIRLFLRFKFPFLRLP